MVGQNIKNYKSSVKYAYDNGMEICNHSQNHKNLKNLSKEEIEYEINSVDDMLEEITGQKLNIIDLLAEIKMIQYLVQYQNHVFYGM